MAVMLWIVLGLVAVCGSTLGRPTEVALEEVTSQLKLDGVSSTNDEESSNKQIPPTSTENLEGNVDESREETETKSDEKTIDEDHTSQNGEDETANEEPAIQIATVIKSSVSDEDESDELEESNSARS